MKFMYNNQSKYENDIYIYNNNIEKIRRKIIDHVNQNDLIDKIMTIIRTK